MSEYNGFWDPAQRWRGIILGAELGEQTLSLVLVTKGDATGEHGAVGVARGLRDDGGRPVDGVETHKGWAGLLGGVIASARLLGVSRAAGARLVNALVVRLCPPDLVLGAQALERRAQIVGLLAALLAEVVEG